MKALTLLSFSTLSGLRSNPLLLRGSQCFRTSEINKINKDVNNAEFLQFSSRIIHFNVLLSAPFLSLPFFYLLLKYSPLACLLSVSCVFLQIQ